MSRYTFEIATESDDAQLRARMSEGIMEGDIAISFRREPSYFAGCHVQGGATQVTKCVDTVNNTIIGLGSRSTSVAYVNGAPQRIGYLADLRSIAGYRGGTLLARGFRFLRGLHDADPVPFYVTVIYDGNVEAVRNLVGGRAGLPDYRELGRILTPAIHFDIRRRGIRPIGLRVLRGTPPLLPQIVRFLNDCQRTKSLAPQYRESDFGRGRFMNLNPKDFFLVMDDKEICGTLAVWDQHAIRQTYVERYSPRLAAIRPVYNLVARVSPLRPLPAPGKAIPFVYLACIAIRNNDPAILRILLRVAYNELRRGPWHYGIAGLDEADPLAEVLGDYRTVPAAGRVFTVHYPSEGTMRESITRPFYLEAGCL